jgi:anti-anti-sigma regulatory factor
LVELTPVTEYLRDRDGRQGLPLGSLIGVHVSRENAKKNYAIVGANERLQNLFNLTKVSQFLITFPTVAEAEAALG